MSNEKRLEYCKSVAQVSWVIEIPKDKFENIVRMVHLTSGEKKIEFLYRFVPKIRTSGRQMIEDFEVLFIKEVVSQGY